MCFCSFFYNESSLTVIYTLSLHDALPIFPDSLRPWRLAPTPSVRETLLPPAQGQRCALELALPIVHAPLVDRKSTRLNSSHSSISYAVFCLKKKNKLRPLPLG